MSRQQANLEQIMIVAERLGPLLDQMVFVGGAVAGLLITDPTAPDARPTDDVDVIVEVSGYGKYAALQAKLRERGFNHEMEGPNCRFVVAGTKVDVMPTDGTILGFSNRWYKLAIDTATAFRLPNGTSIRMINPTMFICTKLEAFLDRGRSDYIASHDLADIIAIVDGRSELEEEARAASEPVRRYLSENMSKLLASRDFIDCIEMHIAPSSNSQEHVDLIMNRLSHLAMLSA
jgi:predicted nucleotidyltransferase